MILSISVLNVYFHYNLKNKINNLKITEVKRFKEFHYDKLFGKDYRLNLMKY